MLNNLSIYITLLFEFTLFGLMILLVASLFKDKVLPSIYQQISLAKKKWQNLTDKKNLIKSTRKTLERKTEKERKHLITLEKKIEGWYKARHEFMQMQQREYEMLKKKITERKQQQKNNIHQERVKKEVMPHALEQAQKELEKQYMGEKGKKVLCKLIEVL